MNDRLKEAFGCIRAGEELKTATKAFLIQKTQGCQKTGPAKCPFYAYAACAGLFLLFLCGRWLYFTPTTHISIDINPSIELSVNRFNRVIFIDGLNEDGRALLPALPIRFMNYTDAIERILENESIIALLSDREIMTITVTGPDGIQSSEIFSGIRDCAGTHRNAYCYFASSEEVAAAHDAGLSYGKYRAFLEVRLLDPAVTPEAIQEMTMREIQDLIDRLSPEGGGETTLPGGCQSGRCPFGDECSHGNGTGDGHRNRRQENCEDGIGNGTKK